MSVRVVDDNHSELHRMPGEDPLFVGLRVGEGRRKRGCCRWPCCCCILFITGLVTFVAAAALGAAYGTKFIGGEVQLFIDQVSASVPAVFVD